jgi:hypothetical protein
MQTRREIVRRRQTGEKLASIARALEISYGAVRNIWQRYEQTGQLEANYERCRHTQVRKAVDVYERAIEIKRSHPGWGAGLIWVALGETIEASRLPSLRTLQRWFRRAGVSAATSDKRAKVRVQRGQAVHEVWAMDAKEQIELADGSYVSWLTITDEGSGAILSARLFPRSTLDKG